MSIPLVSVVMTVYNCEKYIEESLNSIFNQTFRDYEIVVYDDASTDKTWDISKDVIKGHIPHFVFGGKENVGCGEGRNRAISRARGKYIAIQDGDDISYTDRLEKEVEFIESNSDIFCVGSWSDLIDAEGKHIEDMNFPPEDHNDFITDIFNMKNTIIDPSSLFRRDTFNELGGYDPKWNLIPDLYLWTMGILGGCQFANVPEKLVAHRKHDGSVMAKYFMETWQQHKLLHKTLLAGHKKEVFLRL